MADDVAVAEVIREEDLPVVSPFDRRLLSWRESRPGYNRGGVKHDAETVRVESLGLRRVEVGVGDYLIIANAQSSLADVVRFPGYHGMRMSDEEFAEERRNREVVFDGSLSLYVLDKPSDENVVDGYVTFAHERIWIACRPAEEFADTDGLQKALFGGDVVSREDVEALVRGIKKVREQRKQARVAMDHNSWSPGIGQGKRDPFGDGFRHE